MKKYVIAALVALTMASCGEKKFHVEGNITNAKDSVYLALDRLYRDGYRQSRVSADGIEI